MTIKRLWRLIGLNLHVANLAARGHWVRTSHVADGYDRVARIYDRSWLVYLDSITRALLDRMPEQLPEGDLLDLGCGTGFATALLAERYPGRAIAACDISPAMLTVAGERPIPASVEWRVCDMLAMLRERASGSAAAIVAAWSVGYADWRGVLRECGRVLAKGGAVAIVVNLADTLAPIRRAFLDAMLEAPGYVDLAYRSTFPKSVDDLRRAAEGAGLATAHSNEGYVRIAPPGDQSGDLTDWLLKTGVLAGFGAMLPIHEPGPARDAFERALRADPEPIRHHYAEIVGAKR